MHVMTITYDNLIQDIYGFGSAEEMESAFRTACSDYGVEPTDVNFDDGFIELECGHSICMNFVYQQPKI